MALRLTIENMTSLPDGGPLSFTATGKRSIDIGRDQHLDWTLPDPTRYVSGKHCEIHYRNQGYWLHDVSTNGTFLNGSEQRVRTPHELKDGDRLVIGHYMISVVIDDGGPAQAKSPPAAAVAHAREPAAYPELWNLDRDTPPPIDRHQIMTPREAPRPVNPGFLDWAAGVPEVEAPRARRAPSPRIDEAADMDWASGPSRALDVVEPALPVSAPRRPIWKDEDGPAAGASPFLPSQPPISPQPAGLEPPGVASRPQPRVASPAPLPAPVERAADTASGQADFARSIARAAGLPEDFFAGADPHRLAEQLGELMRLSIANLMLLLQARTEAKRLARSATHTTIQATENNPLKFSPTPEDAIRILFGPKTHSYMEARHALEQGFDDLKMHQLKTYSAMQHAVTMLVADMDPAAIDKDLQEHDGPLDRMRSRKSRLWDAFLMRWKASLGREPGAAVDAFMLHFADYYDRTDLDQSR
jgi:type VI secretion system protein ImpI